MTALKYYFRLSQEKILGVNQMYIQFVKHGFCLYSFPPALDLPEKWTDLIDGYRNGDLYHYEIY